MLRVISTVTIISTGIDFFNNLLLKSTQIKVRATQINIVPIITSMFEGKV